MIYSDFFKDFFCVLFIFLSLLIVIVSWMFELRCAE